MPKIKPILLVASFSLVACGGSADFEGRWVGTLTQQATCTGGSSAVREVPLYLTAEQDGDDVQFHGNTSCGNISARAEGDVLHIAPVTCAPLSAEGFIYVDSITGGTMEMRGDILDVRSRLSTVISTSNATGLCEGPLTGLLHRET